MIFQLSMESAGTLASLILTSVKWTSVGPFKIVVFISGDMIVLDTCQLHIIDMYWKMFQIAFYLTLLSLSGVGTQLQII